MQCNICEFRCDIKESSIGQCGMYINENNNIKERFRDSYLFIHPISIETQPMLHFFPNCKFLQLGSVGCNFKCNGCVSNVLVKHIDIFKDSFKKLNAHSIVQWAIENGCKGISFGINEPTMHYYSLLDLAKKAKESGLLFGISTNLYFTKEALSGLIKYIDFVNVGMKGFSDYTYSLFCKAISSKPVFRNVVYLFKHNVHFEVSIPYIKGSENELLSVTKFLSKLSPKIPLQIMRFIPFDNAQAELEPSIVESENLVDRLKDYLNYVYLFNSPGSTYLNTINKNGTIKRVFYGPMGAHISEFSKKPDDIAGDICTKDFREEGFLGGYRITRAIEMVIGILNTIGVHNTKIIADVLGKILKDDQFLLRFHSLLDDKGDLRDYFSIVIELANRSNADPQRLIDYYETILQIIEQKRSYINKKLRSYYIMGTPIFALNTHRFENKLASFVGLEVMNFSEEGKPGINITKEALVDYNPDIAFISGFLSCKEEDFYHYCAKHKIIINAVKNKKVFRLPFGWDFGTPNWIFGLMFIANKAYPEIYNFDIESEYYSFYGKLNNENSKTFYERID